MTMASSWVVESEDSAVMAPTLPIPAWSRETVTPRLFDVARAPWQPAQ